MVGLLKGHGRQKTSSKCSLHCYPLAQVTKGLVGDEGFESQVVAFSDPRDPASPDDIGVRPFKSIHNKTIFWLKPKISFVGDEGFEPPTSSV